MLIIVGLGTFSAADTENSNLTTTNTISVEDTSSDNTVITDTTTTNLETESSDVSKTTSSNDDDTSNQITKSINSSSKLSDNKSLKLAGNTIYVQPNGRGNGRNVNNPTTLARALRMVGDDDTIVLIGSEAQGYAYYYNLESLGMGTIKTSSITQATRFSIVGLEGTNSVISGENSTSILEISKGYNITISNLNFYYGNSTTGGVITNEGSLTLINSVFLSNNANSGVIYSTNGNLTLINTIFAYNNATTTGTTMGNGGVLYLNNTNAIINSSSFEDNIASGNGGAIYSNNSNVNISDSYFYNNVAQNGGTIYVNSGNVSIKDSEFFISKAEENGGTIYNSGNITITNTTLSNSSATKNGLIFNQGNLTFNNNTVNNSYVTDTSSYVIGNEGNAVITNNLFENNTDDSNDILLDDTEDPATLIIHGNEYINNLLEVKFKDQDYLIEKNGEVTVSISLREVYNDTVRNGTITAYRDGSIIGEGPVVNGEATLTLNLDDTSDISFVYTSEEKHYQSGIFNSKVTVILDTYITIDEIATTKVDQPITISGVLYDEHDRIIAGEDVEIYVNDVYIDTVTTEDDGSYSLLDIACDLGTNTIQVIYKGNTIYNPSKSDSTFEVIPIDTQIKLDSIENTYVGETTVITGQLLDEFGNIIASHVSVTITVNGEKYDAITDNQGNFQLIIEETESGIVDVEANYDGDYKYNPSSDTTNYIVDTIDTIITIEPIKDTFVGEETIITGRITDVNGNSLFLKEYDENGNVIYISEVPLTITINGEKQDVITDSEGNFQIIVEERKSGLVDVEASYDGNYKYNPSNTVTSYTVNKIDTIITIEPIKDTFVGEETIITGRITDVNGNSLFMKEYDENG
ncbi:hypothetical protein, partial [Methanosphaera sp.]